MKLGPIVIISAIDTQIHIHTPIHPHTHKQQVHKQQVHTHKSKDVGMAEWHVLFSFAIAMAASSSSGRSSLSPRSEGRIPSWNARRMHCKNSAFKNKKRKVIK